MRALLVIGTLLFACRLVLASVSSVRSFSSQESTATRSTSSLRSYSQPVYERGERVRSTNWMAVFRIAGVPGDHVRIDGSGVYVNDTRVSDTNDIIVGSSGDASGDESMLRSGKYLSHLNPALDPQFAIPNNIYLAIADEPKSRIEIMLMHSDELVRLPPAK